MKADRSTYVKIQTVKRGNTADPESPAESVMWWERRGKAKGHDERKEEERWRESSRG